MLPLFVTCLLLPAVLGASYSNTAAFYNGACPLFTGPGGSATPLNTAPLNLVPLPTTGTAPDYILTPQLTQGNQYCFEYLWTSSVASGVTLTISPLSPFPPTTFPLGSAFVGLNLCSTENPRVGACTAYTSGLGTACANFGSPAAPCSYSALPAETSPNFFDIYRYTFTVPTPANPCVTTTAEVAPTGLVTGTFIGGSVSFTIAAQACATGDPHISGPHGTHVDFHGQGGESYMLFESQQFAVTMRLAEHGPSVRYISAIGLRFQGAALYFDTHPRSLGVVERMNQILKPYNASVVHPGGNRNVFQLQLCPGIAISIVQKVTKIGSKRVGFLNIEFDIPGCHDDFSGVLGQMYQCKWEKEAFVWDPATEESFKVPRLLPPTKAAPCLLPHHFGKPYSGPKGGASSHEPSTP